MSSEHPIHNLNALVAEAQAQLAEKRLKRSRQRFNWAILIAVTAIFAIIICVFALTEPKAPSYTYKLPHYGCYITGNVETCILPTTTIGTKTQLQ